MRCGQGGAGDDDGEADAGRPFDAFPQGFRASQQAARDVGEAPGDVLREYQGGEGLCVPR